MIKKRTDKYPKAYIKIDFDLRFQLIRANVEKDQRMDETSFE